MAVVSVSLSGELYKKLQALSVKNGCKVEDSLELAVSEYIENSEDVRETELNSVSSMERSFFFSAAE